MQFHNIQTNNTAFYLVYHNNTAAMTSPQIHHHQQQSNSYSTYGMTSSPSSNTNQQQQSRHSLVARPKLTTTLWEDEGTICYQVDANGICVARRQGKVPSFYRFFRYILTQKLIFMQIMT
jgi:hypothetical protein